MKMKGKAWLFGDDLGATDIVSSKHDKAGMSHDWAECRKHLMEEIAPNFSTSVAPGDIVIAGHNLGRGHAHYYTAAVMACKEAGISGILCESVNALFQRAAIDQGLLVWTCRGVSQLVSQSDEVDIDFDEGRFHNASRGENTPIPPLPSLVGDIIDAGGSLEWALRRVGAAPQAT